MKVKLTRFIFLFQVFYSQIGNSNEILRPRTHTDLESLPEYLSFEMSTYVPGAEIAWANYAAIKRDFPTLSALSDQEINEWLLTNFSFIGSEQPRLDGIRNSPIPINKEVKKEAFRPYGWVRSAILEARSPDGHTSLGLVDIKGFGHGSLSELGNDIKLQQDSYKKHKNNSEGLNDLRTTDHSDGLMSLGEAIAETTRQTAAQYLFEMSDTQLETVESYAIIHMPFGILKKGNETMPAALYLRQAHKGRYRYLSVPKDIYTDTHGHHQRTENDTAVDFGGVFIRNPKLLKNYGPIIEPSNWLDDKAFDPQKSKPWKYGHECAEAYTRLENPDKKVIYRHINEMLEPIMNDYQNSENVKKKHKQQKIMTRYIEYLFSKGLKYSKIHKILNTKKTNKQKINEPQLSEDSIEELLFDKNSSDNRRKAARFLMDRNDLLSLTLIEKAFSDINPYVRGDLIRALKGRQDSRSLELIKKALNDSDHDNRDLALRTALQGRNDIQSLELIETIYFDSKSLYHTKLYAIEALYGRTDIQSLELIKKIFNDTNHQSTAIKKAAAEALKGRTDIQSLILIEKVLLDLNIDYRVRITAIQALHGRTDIQSLELIKKIFSDKHTGLETKEVKKAAAEILVMSAGIQSQAFTEILLTSSDSLTKKIITEALAQKRIFYVQPSVSKQILNDPEISGGIKYQFYKNQKIKCSVLFDG